MQFFYDMDKPAGKTHPSDLKELSSDGAEAKAVAIFHVL